MYLQISSEYFYSADWFAVGVTAAIAVPLIVIAFNVTRIDGAWDRFMRLGPVRRRFKPSLADYNAGYDLAEMELKMLRDISAE